MLPVYKRKRMMNAIFFVFCLQNAPLTATGARYSTIPVCVELHRGATTKSSQQVIYCCINFWTIQEYWAKIYVTDGISQPCVPKKDWRTSVPPNLRTYRWPLAQEIPTNLNLPTKLIGTNAQVADVKEHTQIQNTTEFQANVVSL